MYTEMDFGLFGSRRLQKVMKAQGVTAWFALIVREMVSRDLLKKVEQVCILLETKKNLILCFKIALIQVQFSALNVKAVE